MLKAWPDSDNLAACTQGNSDCPFAFAQGHLKLLQNMQITAYRSRHPFWPLGFQCFSYAPKIARWLVHVGLTHLNKTKADRWAQVNHSIIGSLSYKLIVNLTGRRNINNKVIFYLALTS